jgi:hypothetical protein
MPDGGRLVEVPWAALTSGARHRGERNIIYDVISYVM